MSWFRQSELRLYFLGIFMLLIMSAMVARLWYVQVKQGDFYAAKIHKGSEVTVRIPSVRGEIRDRNGLPLVRNRAIYEVDLYLPDIVSAYRKTFNKVPLRDFDRITSGGMSKRDKEADIIPILQETVLPRLTELKVLKDFSAEQMRRHYTNDRYVPFTYLEDLDDKTVARLAEHGMGLPGVELSQKAVREYVYGAMAAHILGYVGPPVDISSLPDVDQFNFYQPDVQGKLSVEKHMDIWLRGQPGIRTLRKDAKGQIDGVTLKKEPIPGAAVYLTIDARIQTIVENALRQSGAGRAAAVVIDPNTGNILAMASIPSFDPNIFIPSVSEDDWEALEKDPTIPLLNRALSGYAPGSTYKIMIALAGLLPPDGKQLKTKTLSPGNRFMCIGGFQYGAKFMKCHVSPGSHGSMDLSGAIKASCNAFFFQYGNAAGIAKIAAMGEMLGLGATSNLPVTGEQSGILPSEPWLKTNYPRERWSEGYTANTSIGQGFVLASPLQMAMLAATVANGGLSYYPRLIDKIVQADGTVIEDPPKMRASLIQQGLTAEQIEVVRHGMWRVVNEAGGTARKAQVKNIEVAGKTGTAQAWRTTGEKDNHVWFISFAPYKDPKYAVAVIIQGGRSGGGVAAPVVQKILEESFALDKGYSPEVAKLAPAKGSFRHLDSVNFQSVVAAEFAADAETSDRVQTPVYSDSDPVQRASREKPAAERPNVRARPDAEGRVQAKKPSLLNRLFKPSSGDSAPKKTKRRPPGGRP